MFLILSQSLWVSGQGQVLVSDHVVLGTTLVFRPVDIWRALLWTFDGPSLKSLHPSSFLPLEKKNDVPVMVGTRAAVFWETFYLYLKCWTSYCLKEWKREWKDAVSTWAAAFWVHWKVFWDLLDQRCTPLAFRKVKRSIFLHTHTQHHTDYLLVRASLRQVHFKVTSRRLSSSGSSSNESDSLPQLYHHFISLRAGSKQQSRQQRIEGEDWHEMSRQQYGNAVFVPQ